MKFRNFERIGLTTDEQIKEFLEEKGILKAVAEEEKLINSYIRNSLHDIGLDVDFNNDLVITLLNEKSSETGLPLFCYVHPTIYCNKVYCVYDTSDCVIRMGQHPQFDTMEEAVEFTDKLYGAKNHDEVIERAKALKRKTEGENE